jgi:hypothetical protein
VIAIEQILEIESIFIVKKKSRMVKISASKISNKKKIKVLFW